MSKTLDNTKKLFSVTNVANKSSVLCVFKLWQFGETLKEQFHILGKYALSLSFQELYKIENTFVL